MSMTFKNTVISVSTAFLLSACGGGSGGSESSLSSNVYTGTSTDYSQYAWGINSNIDATFKANYSIDNNAHVNIAAAWGKTKGNSVKVAVIDEDFEVNHPDIRDKIISTYNAMNGSSNVSNTNYVLEDYSHGTGVSGIIASNSLGSAPDVKLILINIDLLSAESGDTSSLTDAHVIAAFDHAQAQGAKVINCSWGGGGISAAMRNKIDQLKAANINVIFASGNDGKNLDLDGTNNDEAELDSVLGVGATAADNDLAYYSNYGSKIDVVAPGGGRDLSNTPRIGVPSLDLIENEGVNNGGSLLNNNYAFTQGTSFAAPLTSGVVALMLAVNPALTPDRIRTILTTTATQIGTGSGADYSVGNFDQKRAFGKINASAAVQQAEDDIP